jgi:predicted amidohydrolase
VGLRIAQIKVYPQKGDLEGNHKRLMSVLSEVSEHEPDVVVTPECFLDGYVVTEEWVSGDKLVEYAIVPEDSLGSGNGGVVHPWLHQTSARWCIQHGAHP